MKKTSDLVNYNEKTSDCVDFSLSQTSSSPNSFPNYMEDSFLVIYNELFVDADTIMVVEEVEENVDSSKS